VIQCDISNKWYTRTSDLYAVGAVLEPRGFWVLCLRFPAVLDAFDVAIGMSSLFDTAPVSLVLSTSCVAVGTEGTVRLGMILSLSPDFDSIALTNALV